jgi:hypothetical protein
MQAGVRTGVTTMNFTVKQNAGQFDIFSDKMFIATFDDEQTAQDEAKRMNAEYERVLSFL